MLEPREVSTLMQTSKWMQQTLMNHQGVWIHLLNTITQRTKSRTMDLEKTIDKVKKDDKRFAFLRKINTTTDPEFNKLIDEYICKRKAIGSILLKPITDARNFIYSGDIQKKGSPEKKPESAAGFFGGWNLGNMLGLAPDSTRIPGTVAAVKPPLPVQKQEEDLSLFGIANSDKHISPETICGMLNKIATRIGTAQPDKISLWLNQLQLCFGMLFRSSLQFYLEAVDVEKLKNFLVTRLEDLKTKLKLSRKQGEELKKQAEDALEV